MKRFFVAAGALAVLALLGSDARAQTGTVRGKIVDESGQGLIDAKITIEYQGGLTRSYSTKTNKKGEYTQVGLPIGDYKITATKDGFQGAYVTLHVGLGEPTQVPELKLVSAETAQKAATTKSGATRAQISSDFKAAYELTQQGKLDEAEAAYKAMLAKTPDIPEVYYNLGFIAGKRKDLAASAESYAKAVELKADYADAISALADTYKAMGQADKAQETLAKAVKDFPDDGAILYNAAVFEFNGGRAAEAAELFKKVEQADPANAEVHYFLGSLSLQTGDLPGATAHLEKYLASAPTNAQFKATAEGLLAYLKKK